MFLSCQPVVLFSPDKNQTTVEYKVLERLSGEPNSALHMKEVTFIFHLLHDHHNIFPWRILTMSNMRLGSVNIVLHMLAVGGTWNAVIHCQVCNLLVACSPDGEMLIKTSSS